MACKAYYDIHFEYGERPQPDLGARRLISHNARYGTGGNRALPAEIRLPLELAPRRGRFQLPTEWLCHRSKDDRHVLSRRSGFISPKMPLPGIHITLALGDHFGRASWGVTLVERDLAFDDLNEDRPGMRMPPS
jgi:hypothetical protein